MNKCKCGCGADVEEGKQYLKGHFAKFLAKNRNKENVSKPEEPKQPEEPMILVSNIRACGIKSENVAWFKTAEGYISKELEFFCTITVNAKESCDYVAVVLGDGSIVPAILLPGFVEISSRHEEPKDEPKPPEIRDIKTPPPEEKPAISQPDEPKDDDSEALRKLLELPKPEKKKGFIERMLGNAT